MKSSGAPTTRDYVRSALFVDFDNVFIELNKIDRNLAARFARNPVGWVRHLEHHHLPDGATHRRVLVRRCYLNPDAFGQFRSSFVAAAFETVDCPPLTFNNKTSADMHIALDMVDALHGMTHFDEFVVMSADADFVPVLMRLRRHDRRTAILASGNAATAYASAADIVITQDAFLDFVAERVAEDDGTRVGTVSTVGGSAASAAGSAAGAFAASAGEASAAAFAIADDEHRAAAPAPAAPALDDASRAYDEDGPGDDGGADGAGDGEDLLERVSQALADIVGVRSGAIDLASLAHALRARLPELADDWGGHERLGVLLRRVDLGDLVYLSDSPGYLYDPARQAPPMITSSRLDDRFDGVDDALRELIERVTGVTGIPRLAPSQYAALFERIAADVDAHGYNGYMQGAKRVRDACTAIGVPVSRQAVTFVLSGLERAGHEFARGDSSADAFARTFLGTVDFLCERAGIVLSDEDRPLLAAWITGGEGSSDGREPLAAGG